MHLFRKVNLHIAIALICMLWLSLLSPVSVHAAKNKKFVVVIDAGHGGKDFGAIENGVNEKDVNLSVALKLGELIKKNLKDTEVIFTRSDDKFVSLQNRANIANTSKADFFISIHCNSVDRNNQNRSNVQGATTYILGQNKEAEHLAVVQRENEVVEKDASDKAHFAKFKSSEDVSHIIYNMSYSQNRRNSIRLAKDIQTSMQNIGRMSRGVQEAGFWVLWSTAMPSVLVELDFICNPEQAKFLASTPGQDKLAGAIFQAVKKYEGYFRQNLGNYNPSSDSMLEIAQNNINDSSPGIHEETSTYIAQESQSIQAADKQQETLTSDSNTGKRTSRRHHKASPSTSSESVTASRSTATTPAVDSASTGGQQTSESNTGHRTRRRHAPKALDEETAAPMAATDIANSNQPPRGRKAASQRRAQKRNMTKVYKILLFTSDHELKANDKAFKNLKGVTFFIENDLYNYTYEETTDESTIRRILKDIKEDFPNAKIIERIS